MQSAGHGDGFHVLGRLICQLGLSTEGDASGLGIFGDLRQMQALAEGGRCNPVKTACGSSARRRYIPGVENGRRALGMSVRRPPCRPSIAGASALQSQSASGLAEIVRGNVRYRLPLTPEAAACLAGALLADPPADRPKWLSFGLLNDPPLALWCALQAPVQTAGPAFSALCDWLEHRRRAEFTRTPAIADPPATAEQSAGYDELLDHSRAVARAAAEIPGADADTVLLALVHRAVDWLLLAAADRVQPEAARAVLPPWLAASLARIEAPGDCGPDSVEARVRVAIAMAADGSRDHHADRRASPCHLGAVLGDRSWSPGSDSLSQFLPQLASRMARLDELEANFDRAVAQAKLEALKEFAYGAGHEINNPLANISARGRRCSKTKWIRSGGKSWRRSTRKRSARTR